MKITLITTLLLMAQSAFSLNYNKAIATLNDLDGKEVGKIYFEESGQKLKIKGTVIGLEKGSKHGIHIHSNGTCVGDFKAAGSHYDPSRSEHHGSKEDNSHYGDLGNIEANKEGTAILNLTSEKLIINVDRYSIIGRSVILHEGSDDLKSQPSGNSGKRIACGVIEGI